MRLQIAMDDGDTAHLLDVAEKIHDVIDIFEVGTPVIMLEGCHAVKAVKDAYPHMCVLADSKIMDGGALECLYLCRAGADIVTAGLQVFKDSFYHPFTDYGLAKFQAAWDKTITE